MNVILIASVIIATFIILGVLLAAVVRGFSRAVVSEQQAADREKGGYNPALTYGYKIPVNVEPEDQMKAARKEAARQAALLPRGENVGIARSNGEQAYGAYKGVQDDPMTAAKIARFHTWEGLRSGSAFTPASVRTHTDAETAPATKSADDLVPGKDYPVIEITDDMSPAEKRKARIANAKAKSAAVKTHKEAGAASASAAAEAPGLAAAAAREPVAGVDYEVIEISDDMSPDEVRKARIANAKAKSAAMKAFKESGAAEAVAVAATPTAAAPVAAPVAAQEPVAGVDYEVIEISDDMSPDEVRKARIANAKAKSAAMKAFKESGGTVQVTTGAAPGSPTVAAQAAPAAVAPLATTIPPPELIEITDDMSPEELRSARIQNAKAKSAYNKALKEAGIDPASMS